MQLTILGSGSPVPSLERSSPANFLKIKNKNILVDCGPGTLRQLLRSGIGYKNIDYLFITHFHNDHIGDFNALNQALKWTPGFTRTQSLIVVGPPGLKKFYKNVLLPASGAPKTFRFVAREIKKAMKFGGFSVEGLKTIHSQESIAYKFKAKGKSIVITGDCEFDEKLIGFAKGTDLLLIECSSAEKPRLPHHVSASECGEIARRAGVKRMMLTHLFPTSPDRAKLKIAKKIFKNTILAKDLMKISV